MLEFISGLLLGLFIGSVVAFLLYRRIQFLNKQVLSLETAFKKILKYSKMKKGIKYYGNKEG